MGRVDTSSQAGRGRTPRSRVRAHDTSPCPPQAHSCRRVSGITTPVGRRSGRVMLAQDELRTRRTRNGAYTRPDPEVELRVLRTRNGIYARKMIKAKTPTVVLQVRSASHLVFNTTELVEEILCRLQSVDLSAALRVNIFFKNAISTSSTIQRRLQDSNQQQRSWYYREEWEKAVIEKPYLRMEGDTVEGSLLQVVPNPDMISFQDPTSSRLGEESNEISTAASMCKAIFEEFAFPAARPLYLRCTLSNPDVDPPLFEPAIYQVILTSPGVKTSDVRDAHAQFPWVQTNASALDMFWQRAILPIPRRLPGPTRSAHRVLTVTTTAAGGLRNSHIRDAIAEREQSSRTRWYDGPITMFVRHVRAVIISREESRFMRHHGILTKVRGAYRTG